MSDSWLELSEKLRKMGVSLGLQKAESATSVNSDESGWSNSKSKSHKKAVESVVSGRFIDTHYGPVFSADQSFGPDFRQGNASLRPSYRIDRLARWAKLDPFEARHYDDFVFLDTETTGLSGGTGTMAFMVGAARFVNGELKLEQFFLQNPAEEAAMLEALNNFCGNMKAVVTYNGKAFDVPILNARYTINRFSSPFEGLPHFDLLPITRRVWKARLNQCNLGNIEHHILGLERDLDEVPGYMVPEIYMDYLHSGDAAPLKGIFLHNANDVVSLAALFSTLNDLLEDPLALSESYSSDRVSIGRVMGGLGEEEMEIALYDSGSQLTNDPDACTVALSQKARIYKRHGEFAKAAPLWEQAAGLGSVPALIELAKLYEHKYRDPGSALRYALKAQKIVGTDRTLSLNQRLAKELGHRVQRLEAKLQSKKYSKIRALEGNT